MLEGNRVPEICGQKLFATNDTSCPKLPEIYLNPHTSARRPLKHAHKLTIVREKLTTLCPPLEIFPKYVQVFDLFFVASAKSPDTKLLHAASVLYQYIDSNDDGIPDNSLVYATLKQIGATMYMFNDSTDKTENDQFFDRIQECENLIFQDLQADETRPGQIKGENYDAALEETFHLVTHGFVEVYPYVFGLEPNSHITCLMDKARGGHFPDTPSTYPSGAWYTYDDETCVYQCMMYEYLYWAYTTYLGAHAYRKDDIKEEWKPSTCLELQQYDEHVFTLFKNPDYNFSQSLPEPLHKTNIVIEDKAGAGGRVEQQSLVLVLCVVLTLCFIIRL